MSKSSLPNPDLKGKVAIITGASRGIGRVCALELAKRGCGIVIAAKTTEPKKNLPGTIFTVADEVRKIGSKALPFKLDIRDAKRCEECVKKTIEYFGKAPDILVNNASALWWQKIEDTPMKKYDLITSINARGTFAMTKACLPHMQEQGFGRIICMSPPIAPIGFNGRTAYNVSKFGMTMVALGVSEEYKGENITAHSLWPATIIESLASINFKLGERAMWRKPEILADCVVGLIGEGQDFSGKMLIDELYLRSRGYKDEDFVKYRCDPNVEPPKLLLQETSDVWVFRGDVNKVEDDKTKDITSKL
eukprot:CAMPEP_0114505666 /NCGR_PEP_ID=MMETSP0109-20121206/10981_1 /TAXON_ID=29199 /ORGANISM="Chlorarachnion reptans, Strain CCCM449" /LENGTH=305 /DNA_ID=CAMNT_0001684133 /DNA_START=140 /DNA_END=1057 /DNA_ORIENTATION=-